MKQTGEAKIVLNLQLARTLALNLVVTTKSLRSNLVKNVMFAL